MSNIADLIEAYILRQLAAQQDGRVELRRTDLADEISCAPSQISYVLSTRFTPAKGFVVESRRGLGGFIRIAQVVAKMAGFKPVAQQPDIAGNQGQHQQARSDAKPATHAYIAAAAATFLEYDNMIFAKKHVRKL